MPCEWRRDNSNMVLQLNLLELGTRSAGGWEKEGRPPLLPLCCEGPPRAPALLLAASSARISLLSGACSGSCSSVVLDSSEYILHCPLVCTFVYQRQRLPWFSTRSLHIPGRNSRIPTCIGTKNVRVTPLLADTSNPLLAAESAGAAAPSAPAPPSLAPTNLLSKEEFLAVAAFHSGGGDDGASSAGGPSAKPRPPDLRLTASISEV